MERGPHMRGPVWGATSTTTTTKTTTTSRRGKRREVSPSEDQ